MATRAGLFERATITNAIVFIIPSPTFVQLRSTSDPCRRSAAVVADKVHGCRLTRSEDHAGPGLKAQVFHPRSQGTKAAPELGSVTIPP